MGQPSSSLIHPAGKIAGLGLDDGCGALMDFSRHAFLMLINNGFFSCLIPSLFLLFVMPECRELLRMS